MGLKHEVLQSGGSGSSGLGVGGPGHGNREKLSSAGGSTFADARERERVIATLQNDSEVCCMCKG